MAQSFNYRWVPSILDFKVNSVVDLKIACLVQTINCTLNPPLIKVNFLLNLKIVTAFILGEYSEYSLKFSYLSF